MPDAIFDVVKAGMEIAKKAPKFKEIVAEEELPSQDSFNRIDDDIKNSLKPGERFLTEAEAKERRELIKKKIAEQGLSLN